MNGVHTCAEVDTPPEARPSQFEERRQHACPDYSFEGDRASGTDPESSAFDVFCCVEFAREVAGTRDGTEKPRQHRAPRLLVRQQVFEVRLVLKGMVQNRRQELKL